ncbi:MAG TPA: hypothetical protein VFD32_24230 [Dehalococcoidia bacterium]|nr:hypothetical protein [Dehalococcoidia bacterium]
MLSRSVRRLIALLFHGRSLLLVGAGALACLFMPGAAGAHDPGGAMANTPSYQVTLMVGPAADILSESQATGLYSGEVMVPLRGSRVTVMNTTDQANPVNHHVAAYIYDRHTGVQVSNVVPAITFVDTITGVQHAVPNVVAMYDASEARSNAQTRNTLHFGNNLFLPDGMYTAVVQIGGETARFADLMVTLSTGAEMARPAVMLVASPYKDARASGQLDTALAGVSQTAVYEMLGVSGQGRPAILAQLQAQQQQPGFSADYGDAVESLDTVMFRIAIRSDAIRRLGIDRIWVVETLVVDQGAIVAIVDTYDGTDAQTMTYLQAQAMA